MYFIRTCSFVCRLALQGLLLFSPFLGASASFAQGTAATVTGFVTDSSGANLPNASVTYTNVATGSVVKATTNSEGLYRLPGILPGIYKGTVSMSGFKTAVKEGIDVQIEAQVTLNYSLANGAASETVTVTADSNVLETTSPTVSQVIEGRQVEDTPLNGRNTMNLVALTPGVVPQGGTNGSASNNSNGGAFTNAGSFGNYQISGGLAGESTTYIDGAPVNGEFGNATAYIITQDAVQEFRVESSVVNPQYGRFGGGVISFETKSGGNQLHGSVYEYFRNTVLNANNFFNNLQNISTPKFNQNQYGATIGAPIKKDRVFIFGSYEGYRLAVGVPNAGHVPTSAELGLLTPGYFDFSADPTVYNPVPVLATPQGAPLPVATYVQARCGVHLNAFCNGAPINAGDAVADPTAAYLAQTLHYFPTPNTSGHGAGINYLANGKAASNNSQETARLDYSLGNRSKMFARFTRFDRGGPATQFFNNPGGPQSFTAVGSTVSQYVLGDTVAVNPTSVLDLRLSYLRYFSYLQPANTTNLSLLDNGDSSGFWAGASRQVQPYFPSISITGLPPAPYTNLNQAAQQPLNLYALSGTYTKLLGRHSLAFGGEARQGEQYFFNFPFLSGFFAFAGTNTACIPSATPTSVTFNDGAHTVLAKNCAAGIVAPGSGVTPISDFVAGQYAAAPVGFDNTTSRSGITRYGGLFVNDTFTISPLVTITAGVRYEHPGNYLEKHDQNAVIVPGLANPLVLVKSAGYSSRGDLVSHNALFSPRVGFSFAPHVGTTVRAGYSLVFIPQGTVAQATPAFSTLATPSTFAAPSYQLCAPLGLNSAAPSTGSLTACQSPGVTAKANILQSQTRSSYAANPSLFYGQNIGARLPFGAFPYLEQWNANVQQAFGASSVVQFAYLGARGEHLPGFPALNINQLPDNVVVNPATAQSLRPYPLYQSVSEYSPFVGDSYYNSAQVTVTKRFHSGGTLLGNYAWSKFLSTTESATSQVETHTEGVPQDNYNLRAERSYLSFDVPQRLVVSYILDLPFGNGKRFLGSSGNMLNRVVSGFNVSGINTFQSGFPLAIVAPTNLLSAAFGGGTPRPNFIAGCNQQANINYVAAAQTGASVINKACFALPSDTGLVTNYFGNQPRTSGILRTQGIDNWDFSIGKTTPIQENINLVFRAEAFNVTNRVQFADPGLTFGSAQFGVLTSQANLPRNFQFSLRVNY